MNAARISALIYEFQTWGASQPITEGNRRSLQAFALQYPRWGSNESVLAFLHNGKHRYDFDADAAQAYIRCTLDRSILTLDPELETFRKQD
jgi:hypothetical protein